jgi:hypothetical protein
MTDLSDASTCSTTGPTTGPTTASAREASSPAALRRPLTVTEWSRQSKKWVVSARLEATDDWTLVGVFEEAEVAFRAAELASERLAFQPRS